MSERRKVLVVDDEADLRAISRMALESEGFQVFQAENGRKGLEVLREHTPDLILVDLMMPEMNGIEFCRRVIEDLKLGHVPILVISGVNRKSQIVKQYFDLPIEKRGFLVKPVGAQEILAEVRALLGTGGPAPAQPKGAAAAPKPGPAPSAPASPPPAAAAPPKADPKAPRIRVLTIDDDEDIRTLLKTTLSLRYQVEMAENGMAGLAAIDRFEPDFVICDINMPLMNGIETVEAIRRHPRFSTVPVFFLSAETDTNLPRKAFEIGANLFLRKPLDPMRMLKLLDHFVAETGLKPRERSAPPPPGAKPVAASSGAAPVRILTVDANPDNVALLKKLLEDKPGRKLEKIWSEEVRTAFGNLMRWEPDVILYNPRNPAMDGIAFGQVLRMKKLAGKYEIAFISKEFFDADVDYSRKNFQRDPIRLDPADPTLAAKLQQVFDAARSKASPKQRSFEEIEREDAAHRDRLKAERGKVDMQREIFRDKFKKIQDFIDQEQWKS